MIRHDEITANGARFHVARTGQGPALLLLHGWPEFWLTWEPVMQRLADRFTLIAPDLRGFGDSDKPPGPYGADGHADDLLALLDAMGQGRVGVVGHDVGGAVMQVLARRAPQRFTGLFFFDFVHPGVGARMGTPDRLNEIWYQSFHQMPFAPALVGASRETCGAYIGHFLRHWSHRQDAFDDVFDAWIDNFLKPGNLAGGFAWYQGAHAGRMAMMRGDALPLPPIDLPTCVRWGAQDTVLLSDWVDRLGETFVNLDCALFPGVGHFPHREDPDRAAAEIAQFFSQLKG
jgi:pimeloyl-ACP methyl ester carboxylesterase